MENLLNTNDHPLIQVFENVDYYYEQAQRRTDAKIIEQADAVYFLGVGTPSFWQVFLRLRLIFGSRKAAYNLRKMIW